MAPAIATLSAAVRSTVDVQYMFEHVFLPPKLPQAQEDPEKRFLMETKLIDAPHSALKAFRDFYPPEKASLNNVVGGLGALSMTLAEGTTSEAALLEQLALVTNAKLDVLPVYVQAQNAGIIITRKDESMVFETFELSPTNTAVNGTAGRLIRQFPGGAVIVSKESCHNAKFQGMLAHTLSRMSKQTVPGMQPKSNKSGTMHDEDRDTTHPGAVTELLTGGILKGIGEPYAAAATIVKHTRDEVLWKEGVEIPWRRSPIWMLLRVFLQLRIEDRHLYKTFITFFAASILKRADELFAQPTTLFVMSLKIIRRLGKLGNGVSEEYRACIASVIDRAASAINNDWESIQGLIERRSIGLGGLRNLDPAADSHIFIPDLTSFAALNGVHIAQGGSTLDLGPDFHEYPDASAPRPGFLLETSSQHLLAALSRFEDWMPEHLSKCIEGFEVDDACRLVYRLLREYHDAASKQYVNDPESHSRMLLTSFELWIACDKQATGYHSELEEYDLGIPVTCLQSLLLPFKRQMKRISDVESYLNKRAKAIRYEGSQGFRQLFGDPLKPDARKFFPVRYFNRSPDTAEMQGQLTQIRRQSEFMKIAKIRELKDAQAKHAEIIISAKQLDHSLTSKTWFFSRRAREEKVHDVESCKKCDLEKEAAGMKISIFEAQLPSDENEAKAIVFELRLPEWFAAWRDSTIMLISDVLKAEYASGPTTKKPQEKYSLPEDKRLKQWYKPGDRRIIMASVKKAHSQTHFKEKSVTESLREDEVCVANGLLYRYVDGVRQQFLGTFEFNNKGYTNVQVPFARALKPIECGSAALCSKCCHCKSRCSPRPSQGRGVWRPLIDFSKIEAGLFVLQCINQVGPTEENGSQRIAHHAVEMPGFAQLLLRNLEAATVQVRDNWEFADALAVFAAITCRLLMLSSTAEVQRLCKDLLTKIGDIAFGWVEVLRTRSQNALTPVERNESRVRAMRVALTCIICYDVNDGHLATILQEQAHVARLLQCSIILGQREYSNPNPFAAILLMRSKRVLQHSRKYFRQAGIDEAIGNMWSQYRVGDQQWQHLSGDLAHWVEKETVVSSGRNMTIHLNTLSGTFLVNGKVLRQTPSYYQKNAIYKRLFGDLDIEVVPSPLHGMSLMISRLWEGCEVHLGWTGPEKTGELQVLAFNNGVEVQLIPNRVFHGHFPKHFEVDFVHWRNRNSGIIDFRPVTDPWKVSSPDSWHLFPSGDLWKLRRGDTLLLGSQTRSSQEICSILSPLADATQVHVFQTKRGLVEVELPAVQVGFSLQLGSSSLRSREFPDMIVEDNAKIGTLYGLSNKLLLRSEKTGQRRLLLPEGNVVYAKNPSHVQVTVDRVSIIKVHALIVNTDIGYLEDTGSLQCKLYLAYLHALTSYCLPDPLTSKTGTEQALTILESAATRSLVKHLTPSHASMLVKIAGLAPSRAYYPSRDSKPMQILGWDERLSFLSQHGRLCLAAKSIMRQSEQSMMFYLDTTTRLPEIAHADDLLLARDLARSSTFRVWGFGAECHGKEADAIYEARDTGQDSTRAFKAFTMARMICSKDGRPHWPVVKSGHFTELVKEMLLLFGLGKEFDQVTMKYDASIIETTPSDIMEQFPALHRFLASGSATLDNFTLLMWLSIMAFAQDTDLSLIQMVALCFTSTLIGAVRQPQAEIFEPSAGYPAKNGHGIKAALSILVRDAAKLFEYTPAAALNGHSDSERRNFYERKVRAAADHFVRNCADWWRTGRIQVPQLGEHAPYLDAIDAETIVKKRFQVYRDNVELQRYFDQLQVAAHGLPANLIVSPACQPMAIPRPFRNAGSGVSSVRDLFAGPAPNLTEAVPMIDMHTVEGDEIQSSLLSNTGLQLGILVNRMSPNASKYEKMYLGNLRDSLHSLNQRETSIVDRVTSKDVVVSHLAACQKDTSEIYCSIMHALSSTSQTTVHQGVRLHLPHFSPSLLLQQLNRHHWPYLSQSWKECIVAYGLALTAEQRATRLLRAWDENEEAFSKELENSGHTNWSPFEFPESLLLEVESSIMIRPVQEQIAAHMRCPPDGKNAMMQLNMGEGKSSVIVPIVAAALADGSQLVRVVVAKPQSSQMMQMLISKLGGLLDRRIFYMPFSRAVRLTPSRARAVRNLCEECMAQGGIMLVQPEHILSFQLMGPECFVSYRDNAQEIGRSVLATQDFLDKVSRDIVDESDENFDCRFELVYTMGVQRPIELKPQRWKCIQDILDLIRNEVAAKAAQRPGAFEVDESGVGRFPRMRILDSRAGTELLYTVARRISQHGMHGNHGFPAAQHEADQKAALKYMTSYDLTDEDVKAVQAGPLWTKQYRTTLLLLRGLFACHLLAFVFEQKRWRVNYGLADRKPPTRLAVPYRAKDSPSLRAEFSHPDVVIVFTSLSYYYGGLEDEHLFLAIGHLQNSDQKDQEYQNWIRGVNMPEAFRELNGVNLKDVATCISKIFPRLRTVKGAIDYFLSNIVFEKEMREFASKMSASGWDIGKVKGKHTTGFSGTNDSRDLLPLDVEHLDLDEQRHTNALVLDRLLQPQNSVALVRPSKHSHSDAERLLEMVLQQYPMPQVILDVGAQILELGNEEFAKLWLKLERRGGKEAAIFCNDADELTVVDKNGNMEPLQTSSFATRLNACLVCLDEAHTRGIDLKLPLHYRAAVTLGADLTKDRLVQACMRMRQLGHGQTVVFCVSEEIRAKILAGKTAAISDNELSVMDVLEWAICGTFTFVERSIPLWVTQGHRFVWQEGLWAKLGTGKKTALTPQLAKKFLEPEARTIEFRYSPGREFDLQLKRLTDPKSVARLPRNVRARLEQIKNHSEIFGNPLREARRLLEEQERELSPEKEEQRHDERAPPATAAKHTLHPHLVTLVKTGRKPADTNALQFAFATLKKTSASKVFDASQFGGQSTERLLSTVDFATTVKEQNQDSEYVADAFLRPVQWILSIRQPKETVVETIILISPFEARKLMKLVRESQFAALHLYKPRTNIRHASLDHLDFFTIRQGSSGSLKISSQLITQLNVFAGQLYFASNREYLDVCNFLGLSYQRIAPGGWEVEADHFIRKDGSGRIGGMSGLKDSPVAFLKVFYSKIRRHGEDISKTHMGRVLGGAILSAEDFQDGGQELD